MKLKSLAFFGLMLLSQETMAQEDIGCSSTTPYYAGASYSFRDIAFKNNIGKLQLEKRSKGLQGLLGYKYNDNLGFELGVAKTGNRTLNSNSVKSYHLSLDAVGFYPISNYAEILGGVGIGASKLSYNTVVTHKFKKSSIAPRLLAGAQLNVTDTIKFRLSSSLEGFGKIKKSGPYKFKSILSYGFGLVYSF